MEYLLSTENLTKEFKKQRAVDKVNLHVRKGEIYGFIGRNGAGKTTFLKMISGLTHPSSGEITLFGKKGQELYSNNVFSKIGSLIEAPGLYKNMSAYENMKTKALCLGIKGSDKILELLTLTGLNNTGRKKVKNFSLGMKQRLGIAMALLGDPELLILDEPINGLDPQGIAEIREIILKLNKERDLTIIISSHILEELTKVATYYGIINDGKILVELSKEELENTCYEKNSSIEAYYFQLTGGI